MTWHNVTVPADRLGALLTTIRKTGGTVTRSQPDGQGVRVTWTTAK